ncbi:MAG TPA: hypothetical protein VMV10_29710 [Pirellulales bacterium]|nr:hypothetical protein [Pirellulales bacterium]
MLAGAVLASLFFAVHGASAERASKHSGRDSTRQDKTEARLREKNRDRLRVAKARSRTGRRAGAAQTEELFGISWFGSLESARSAAAKSKSPNEGKPVFCFRVLGDLAGFM